MGIAIIVVLIALTGAILLVAVGVAGAFTRQARNERDADQRWDDLFDGRNTAVYEVTAVSPPAQQALEGARQRGYRLVSDSSEAGGRGRMIFEKVD